MKINYIAQTLWNFFLRLPVYVLFAVIVVVDRMRVVSLSVLLRLVLTEVECYGHVRLATKLLNFVTSVTWVLVIIRAVPNIGLTLFGRIQIVVPTIRPNTNTNLY